MNIERRTSTRRPVDQEVMIIHERGHRLCKIHDLSLKGAMLQVGWSALTSNVPVELTISLPANKGKATFRLLAQVARVSKDGTAIKFRDLDDSAAGALQRYLRAEQEMT